MRYTRLIAVVTMLLLAMVVATSHLLAQQRDAEVLLQQAKHAEQVEGNLEQAISLYSQLLEDHPDVRDVAAKAQLHIGLCYEKLGLTEARQAYRNVIDDFPEQREEVATAQQRLVSLTDELAELHRGPTLRKIEIATKPQNGVLSPDGTQLAFTSQGSLWLLPLQGNVVPDMAGEPVRLTEPMGAWNSSNVLGWSGDGERIAFSASTEGTPEIHVVSVATGGLTKIPGNHFRGNKHYDYRLSLSPDGKTLAFVHMEREGSTLDCPAGDLFVHTRPVEGGEPSRLTPVCTMQPAFSPDGRYIAYIRVFRKRDLDDLLRAEISRQLWVVPAAGGTPELLLDSAQIWSPVWSPDGGMIAVLSEPEEGTLGQPVWVVPFAPGAGLSEPLTRFELPSAADGLLAGWTPGGELGVHLKSQVRRAVYTASAEGGNAVQVTSELAEVYFPRWSPDGSGIILTAGLHHDDIDWVPLEQSAIDTLSADLFLESEDYFFGLASIPAEGGAFTPIRLAGDTTVIPGVPPGGGIHVSPDGSKILFAGIRYPEPEPGTAPHAEVDIWTVPREGGTPTRLARSTLQDRFPCWSPDGEQVAFLRYEFRGKGHYAMNIHVVPGEGGEPVRLSSDADSVEQATIAYSPDGERIAFFSPGGIKSMPADGGDAEVLIAGVPSEGRHRLAWSPDGRRIAYTAAGKIWMASGEGGEPVELRTGLPLDTRYGDFGWSPDGSKLTFIGVMGGEVEFWLISDFLP